jgi:hypothetical protein
LFGNASVEVATANISAVPTSVALSMNVDEAIHDWQRCYGADRFCATASPSSIGMTRPGDQIVDVFAIFAGG